MGPEPGRTAILQIVAALIRQGDEVLLVRQQGPADPFPTWALPGGRVEAGEGLSAALEREVREETGLEIHTPGRLLYLVESYGMEVGSQTQVFVFEVTHLDGEIRVSDPDGFIQEARFFLPAEAIARVEQLPWRTMREPLLAYLRGSTGPGAVWFYTEPPSLKDG